MGDFWFTKGGVIFQDSIKRIAYEVTKKQYTLKAKTYAELKAQIVEAVEKGHTYVYHFDPASDDDVYVAIMKK